MEEFFMNNGISDVQKSFLHQVLDIGFDFMNGALREGQPLVHQSNEELKKRFSEELPYEPKNYDSLLDLLKKISKYSISQSDTRFLAFPDVAGSVATYAADIIESFLNQNLIAVERSAPAATFIEAQLIRWLRFLVGYESSSYNDATCLSDLGGLWTSGGNMSNHIAILTALLNKYPEITTKGIMGLKKRPVIILSKGIAHYSFLNAAKVLGLGSDSIVWLDTDRDFKTSVSSIEHLLSSLPDNVEPFMIVSVAGNCRTSSIDHIKSINRICREKDIWCHVDACHGGSLLFSEKLKKQISGVEYADSVTIDPHKGLFVTYSSSYVLFKNPKVLNVYCRYKGMTDDSSVYDIGLITPFYGSRGFESLKLWLLIQHLGVKKIGECVEHRNELYLDIIKKLESLQLFVFFNKPEMYRSAFVFFPEQIRHYFESGEYNEDYIVNTIRKYTKIFADRLYKRGKVIIDIFKLNDYCDVLGFGDNISYDVLGLSMGHVELSEKIIQTIIEEIVYVGSAVTLEMQNNIVKGIPNEKKIDGKVSVSPASW